MSKEHIPMSKTVLLTGEKRFGGGIQLQMVAKPN